MKAVLSSPTYGPVDPMCVKAIRSAVMHAGNNGVTWVGDASPDRMSFMDARNNTAEAMALDYNQADGVLWVDSDMVPGVSDFSRLMHGVRAHGFDALSALYFQRRNQHSPCFFQLTEDLKYRKNEVFEENKIIEIGACGFGLVWTSTRLLKAIAESPNFNPDRGAWFPNHMFGGTSEDLGFCRLAREAGFKLWLDTGIQPGHMGEPEVIGKAHYLAKIAPPGTPRVEVR